MKIEKYLGDGLYAELTRDMIRLYTQQGDEVFLEYEVFESLLKFGKTIWPNLYGEK